jgi:hypothetical protein
VVADLGTGGVPAPVSTMCSASGHRVAVCSAACNEYAVFAKPDGRPWRRSTGGPRTESALWQRCDAGYAKAVVWHFRHDVIALLVAPSQGDAAIAASGFRKAKVRAPRSRSFMKLFSLARSPTLSAAASTSPCLGSIKHSQACLGTLGHSPKVRA